MSRGSTSSEWRQAATSCGTACWRPMADNLYGEAGCDFDQYRVFAYSGAVNHLCEHGGHG
eukprot:5605602-Prorocentrum_lima.AAC.1